MSNFARCRNKTVRARAKEGTYSISKGKGFDSAGFQQYAAKADADFTKTYRKKAHALGADYKAGKISYDEYAKSNAKAFNTCLVQLHEAYRSGQKKYGYTYSLEK